MTDSRQLSPTSTLHDPDHRSSALEKVDLAEKGSAVPYEGQGTTESPFIVKFLDGEQANPQNWSKTKKWYVSPFFPAYSRIPWPFFRFPAGYHTAVRMTVTMPI